MSGPSTTFVTVVFDPELELLRLQARSFALHLPAEIGQRIVVVDNTRVGLSPDAVQQLRDEYGPLRDRVQLIRPDSIARIPKTSGWYAQQIVKLAVAAQVTTPAYVVLDAKNHLVRGLTEADLWSADGRLRSYTYSFAQHPLRKGLERTLAWFGLPADRFVERFTPAVTPFALDTATVRDLIADFERRLRLPFPQAFLRADLLEFFAYAAFVIKDRGAIEALYALDQDPASAVWPGGSSTERIAGTLEAARTSGSPWFAVHRRAFARLDRDGRRLIGDFWIEVGLADRAEGDRLMAVVTEGVMADERTQRRSDLITRARRVVRRRLRAFGGRSRA